MPTFDELIAPLRAEFADITQALANRDLAIEALNVAAEKQAADLEASEARLAAANARIAELEAGNPPPPPPPPTVRKVTYGACPDNAHTGNAASVVAKYGDGASVRWFSNGLGVPVRPAGCSLMHCSWKPSLNTVITRELVAKLTVNLKPGDHAEPWHEMDVKHRKAIDRSGQARADADLAQMKRIKAEWFVILGEVRPDLRMPNTLAAGRFHPTWNNNDPRPYYVPAHLLGVDFDGTKGAVDWTECLSNVQAFADEHYEGQWTVPEYAWDKSVTNRLQLMQKQTPVIAAAGPVSIMWFDFDGGQLNDAEVDYWRGRVAA